WPFNAEVTKNTWTAIEAAGFAQAVPGCVYEGAQLDGGVPLGGLGTGYFTLEGSGKIGHCSIYNDIVPPRRDFSEWLVARVAQSTLPLSTASIAYWGHYPVADLLAEFDEMPLQLGLRAFSPFIVGDSAASNIPATLFEVEITNTGLVTLDVALGITPPAPPAGKLDQVALVGENLQVTNDGKRLSATVDLSIAPGQSKRVRFVFGWYFPNWRDSSNEAHVHRYGLRYAGAAAVAQDMLRGFDALLGRVLAWQNEVYRTDLPAWLCDALVQGFYSLAKNSVWIARTRNDEWWDEAGWFTHNESHTGCPITETMVCRMHGHFPVLFFFPELEASTLHAFRHFQISDGEIPFSYGMQTSLRDPRYHCQHPLNSGQYAQMVYRLYLRTGDHQTLARFYDSARRAIRYQFSLDDDDDGLVNDQAHVAPGEHWPANQFYDIWPWWGTSAYVAGTWLATLATGCALAEEMDDDEFASECNEWLGRGLNAYNNLLWTGEYYRLWNDPANGRSSDVSLGNQLMAQWCVKVLGLPDLLPEENVQSALGAVSRLNMAATAYGLVNGVMPDGTRFDAGWPQEGDHARHTFVGENLCAAETFIYHGHEDVGLEIARRIYEAIALKSRSPWNQRCLISSESGLPVWGDDYYSNLVIWSLPMALAGEDIQQFVQPGTLVDRMIRAAGEESD
ncbi:MAG TPA: GH116 family glycosyl hydrolase, partial [Anaerolineae bacterium]